MSVFTLPFLPALGLNGQIASGAKLFFYLTQTSTLTNIYADADLTTPLPNPVVANDSGRFADIFLDDKVTYRVRLETNAGALIDEVDPLVAERGSSQNYSVANIRDYYVSTDPDWTNAFERAIYEAFPDQDSLEIYVGPGEYFISRQLIPRRTITLGGAGSTVTRLIFDNINAINATMRGAIALGLQTTLAAYTTNPNNYPVRPNNITAGGADQSQIRDLAIIIRGIRPVGFNYGIWNAARATITNVTLFSAGLQTVSGALIIGSGAVIGNANTSLYQNVNSLFAPEHAFVTDGTDSNNITFDRCSAFVPGNTGFYEGSQFGNTYRSCHREGVTAITAYGYRSINPGGSNRSSFIECYNEGDACTVARWDIASGSGIKEWQGAIPEALGNGKNTWLAASNLAGWVTAGQINSAANGDGFSLGSSAIAATRMSNDGFFVRGGDGTLAAMSRGGDGSYLTRNGVAVMKLELGAAIANPSGGTTIDVQARDAINSILATMRAFRPTIAP